MAKSKVRCVVLFCCSAGAALLCCAEKTPQFALAGVKKLGPTSAWLTPPPLPPLPGPAAPPLQIHRSLPNSSWKRKGACFLAFCCPFPLSLRSRRRPRAPAPHPFFFLVPSRICAPACPLRAGIKKPAQQRYRNTKGVDPKFLRNQRYVTRGIRKVQDGKVGGAAQ